ERRLRRVAACELLHEGRPLVEAHLPSRDRRPEALLFLVEVLGVDALPLALDHPEPPRDVGRDRHEPRRGRELAARAALDAPARRGGDARALAVEVGVRSEWSETTR